MQLKEYMADRFLILDGGMGTLLQQAGLPAGEYPERWNLTHADVVLDIQKAYFAAGSRVVNTNTFGANGLKFAPDELRAVIKAGVRIAKEAKAAAGCADAWVALDIGPTGRLLKPYGDLDFEDAVAVFAETVKIGVAAGVDLVMIETMSDSYETKAALLAAKENCDLPVFVSCAFGGDGKLLTGADPAAMVALLEGMGADAVGANCSQGPRELLPVVGALTENASVPVLFKPNAGLPHLVGDTTVYDVGPDEFAEACLCAVDLGARIFGGCCGTTPAHIKTLCEALKGKKPAPLTAKNKTVVSSYTHAVDFDNGPVLIGERINPTGKKRLKEALTAGDMGTVLRIALDEANEGADILDVNAGLPLIDEAAVLTRVVTEVQAVCDLPLQIDTADPVAMERALRRHNGKPMINSVTGKTESMRAVFPLAKKYGGLVVALTLDENGIPDTAAGRLAIAERILTTAKTYGLAEKDLIFDPLAMPVSATPDAAKVTLDTLTLIREKLGCRTSLGISNVSFGLPEREVVNGAFLAAALSRGLSAAIANPGSVEVKKVYCTHRLLMGLDENCADYIAKADLFAPAAPATTEKTAAAGSGNDLKDAIFTGRRDAAAVLAAELLKTREPLDLIEREIVPALDRVGVGFEQGTVYLPQLLMSAEAAGTAFEEVRRVMRAAGAAATKCKVVLATVRGDIHDIGKNIVHLLLENYGFRVIDLGRDVPPETVLETARREGAPLVGLSALMTTTLPAMAETVALLHRELPDCRVMVGGAVLTAAYAEKIGADSYGKDAMEAVRYAESVFSQLKVHN